MSDVRGLKERKGYIDLLKVLGISCIILAHVNPPRLLFEIRAFDVPLMVILSAYLGGQSIQKYCGVSGTAKYCLSRFKRLVIPTWIFLVTYFLIIYIIDGIYYDAGYYIKSFLLTRYAVGYVWIILVYLYVALLMPVFRKTGFHIWTVVAVSVIYVLYEIAFGMGLGTSNVVIGSTVFTIVPYGALAYLGYNFDKISSKLRWAIAGLFVMLYIALAMYYRITNGAYFSVQNAKYPPRIYFFAFGIAISMLLILICKRLPDKITRNAVVRFLSVHSLELYLCHIYILYIYSALELPERWYLKYAVVYGCTVLIVFAVCKIIDLIRKAFGAHKNEKF